jgi:hypothetical protein
MLSVVLTNVMAAANVTDKMLRELKNKEEEEELF